MYSQLSLHTFKQVTFLLQINRKNRSHAVWINSHSYICLKLTFCSPKILSIINVERQCPALISMSAIQETSLCRGALIEINKNNRVTSFPQGTSSFFRLMIFNLIEWAAQTLLFACNPKQCRQWEIQIPSPQNKNSEKNILTKTIA